MKRKNAPCGNNCNACPKKKASDKEEYLRLVKLWHKVGFSDRPLPISEMSCKGCSVEKNCRYEVSACADEHRVDICSECKEFPCVKVGNMLLKTKEFAQKAKMVCTEEEYDSLRVAFFNKAKNLLREK